MILRLLLACLLTLLATPAWAAVAQVSGQVKIEYDGGTSAPSITFASNVTAGNMVVLCVATQNNSGSSRTVSSATLGSDTFTEAITFQSTLVTQDRITILYLKNATGGTATVTATLSGAADNAWISAHEVSGADTSAPLDQTGSNEQASNSGAADAITSGSVTTTADGEYIYGCSFDINFTGDNYTAGTGYTGEHVIDFGSEYKVQSTQGSVAATFTGSASAGTITAVATFKASTGGGGGGAPMKKRRIYIQ